MNAPLNVAVVGAGVSGITSAFLLQDHHNVTLYEKKGYIGGHTNTVVIDRGADAGTPVDTGFIVMNNKTYPLFNRLLERLGVSRTATDMSFSYTCRQTGLQYASSNLNTLFAQRKNLFRPSFWRFLYGVNSLMKGIRRDLQQQRISGLTLEEYMARESVGTDVMNGFILPMAAAIWSAPDAELAAFPMETFARFYENHGLLTLSDHPQWYVVSGGSHTYVKAFLKGFKGEVRSTTPVTGIRRTEAGVVVTTEDGRETLHDRVIVATHADEAFKILKDPSPEEKKLFAPWRYASNRVVLHCDTSLLPSEPRARASWNYIRGAGTGQQAPITVTYLMNRLQNLTTEKTWCVTLNPSQDIPAEAIHKEVNYDHPLFTFDSVGTQEGLRGLNGKQHTFFCGSYFGYGFHEDAVKSAVDVAKALGGTL